MFAVQLTIRFDWCSVGNIGLDGGDRPRFPKVPRKAGLYRFDFDRAGTKSVYIGETDQLDRRLQHYRTPDPSQRTNQRLNALMRETLTGGGTVSVSIVDDDAVITTRGRERAADLLRKSERVLLEHAALTAVRDAGIDILNI